MCGLGLLLLVAFFGCLCIPVFCQEQSATSSSADQTPPEQPKSHNAGTGSPDVSSPDVTDSSKPVTSGDDRLFWALPNLLTVENAAHVPPLTAKQKFGMVARTAFDPVEYPYYAFVSAIGQAENSEPAYGQGWAAYGKRYGTSFADGTIENFMTSAVYPSLLKQDPRYYQLGQGSFLHRAGYAVSRILIIRTDAGTNQFNLSEVLGAGTAAGISNAYHPAGDRTFPNTMSVWGTQMGWDTVSIVVKEFWPDIHHKFTKRKPEDP